MSHLPPAPSAVVRILHEEAAPIRVDPVLFWLRDGCAMSFALRRARHEVWRRVRDEVGWSASRIGRLFRVSHRAVLYGIEQAEARRARAGAASPRAAA